MRTDGCIVDPLDQRHHLVGRRFCSIEPTCDQLRPRPLEQHLRRLDRGLLGGGDRTGRIAEQFRGRTRLERRQSRHHSGNVVDDASVGFAQHFDRRGGAHPRPVETRHALVHPLRRVLAANRGLPTCLGMHRDPRLPEGVELPQRQIACPGRVGEVRLHDRPIDGVPLLRVPGLCQALICARARVGRLPPGRPRPNADQTGHPNPDHPLAPRRSPSMVERIEQSVHRRPSRTRFMRQPADERSAYPGGNTSGSFGCANVRASALEVDQILSLERSLTEQALPDRHAKGELVGSFGDVGRPELLGCHVRGRAQQTRPAGELRFGDQRIDRLFEPFLGDARVTPRDAEIQDPHAESTSTLFEHCVGGFEVPVNDACPVRSGQALPCLPIRIDDLPPATRSLRLPVGQRGPADELHRDEEFALIFANLVHLHDVRVGELGHRLGLATHPIAS